MALQRPPRHVLVEDKPVARDFQQTQDNTENILKAVSESSIVGGHLVVDEDLLSASTVLIAHKLGRAFQGWAVTDKQGDARVWRDTTSTADTKLFLALKCSADVTVDLWIF